MRKAAYTFAAEAYTSAAAAYAHAAAAYIHHFDNKANADQLDLGFRLGLAKSLTGKVYDRNCLFVMSWRWWKAGAGISLHML